GDGLPATLRAPSRPSAQRPCDSRMGESVVADPRARPSPRRTALHEGRHDRARASAARASRGRRVTLSLSVVVCTHNRPHDLERCLLALSALQDTGETTEVVVVDSASRPSCRDLVRKYDASLPRLEYVREDEPGLSRARNRGLAAAR